MRRKNFAVRGQKMPVRAKICRSEREFYRDLPTTEPREFEQEETEITQCYFLGLFCFLLLNSVFLRSNAIKAFAPAIAARERNQRVRELWGGHCYGAVSRPSHCSDRQVSTIGI